MKEEAVLPRQALRSETDGLQKKVRTGESVIGAILFFCGFLSIFTTMGIVITLGVESFYLFGEEQCVIKAGEEVCERVTITEFLTTTDWLPESLQFGVLPLVLSTMTTSVIAIAIALPLGLGAAIYLSEYADRRVRKVLKPILEILAGIPTVVYGYFALTFVTPILREAIGEGTVKQFNMASAGIVVGIMILPLVASMSEDALSSVPRSLREGSAGLGSTKLETTVRVILPAAVSGVIAALIIAVSRAVGETMIVAIAAGAGPQFTFIPFNFAETMTGHIARISGGDISFGSVQYNSLFSIGLLLFLMTLGLNILGRYLVRRFREVYE